MMKKKIRKKEKSEKHNHIVSLQVIFEKCTVKCYNDLECEYQLTKVTTSQQNACFQLFT